jgi:hypothetical protein
VKAEKDNFSSSQNPSEHRLIRVYWKEMIIELCFNKALGSFEWTEKSLKENLNYLSLSNIYSDIELDGWKVHPRTPMSALNDGEGITFKKVDGNRIVLEIDWETYSVFGYAQNSFCQGQLQIADSSMPKECYVGVEKRLPLKILVEVEVEK